MTNVIQDAIPGGRINVLCTKKKEATERAKQLGWSRYPLAALGSGLYLDPYRSLELLRLREELLATAPNLAVTLGPTALWALCGSPKIGKLRGTILESTLVPGLKVLPTYHPRTVLADYAKKHVLVADLIKAKHEQEFSKIRRPKRRIYMVQSPDDIRRYHYAHLSNAKITSIDIETLGHRFISMIGFSNDPRQALVVPFISSMSGKKGTFKPYWSNFDIEFEAWEAVREIIDSRVCILGQNFIYDTQYLLMLGFIPRAFEEDLMLRQHAKYIELEKSLGFLASIHTNEVAWKEDRKRGQAKVSELKEDD
jgi:hypothetical protein